MFAEVLQQVMVCELDEQLGYEKGERKSDSDAVNTERNYRNGYSKKTVKTQLGEAEINVPRDRKGSLLKSYTIQGGLRKAISFLCQKLGRKLEHSFHILRISSRDSEDNIYDEYH